MNQQYFSILQNAGIRPSVQRLAIYGCLCMMKNHPTADMVHQALEKSYPTLSRTTCYNTLKLFEKQKIIQSVQIEDEAVRYDADTTEHFHFKCTGCQNVFDIQLADGTVYEDTIHRNIPDGFSPAKIQTNIWGLCPNCKNSQNQNGIC